MQLINVIEFFKGFHIIGAKIIWNMFMEEIEPELLADLNKQSHHLFWGNISMLFKGARYGWNPWRIQNSIALVQHVPSEI